MKLAGAFLRLIRWPNLAFIAITQCLFHFCLVKPAAYGSNYSFPLQLNSHLFVLLCIASVLIAAAGYIINDYFDINIDLVNKPHKMVVDKIISRRWALFWHLLLSAIGIGLSVYVSWRLNNYLVSMANTACVLLLWYYSTSYKRQLLIGNIIISALTAWVILVILVAELPEWLAGDLVTNKEKIAAVSLTSAGLVYAAFAFILSIIREVIKDIEDLNGDLKDGCRTMPIVWGVNASKIFIAVWLVVLIATLSVSVTYLLIVNWWTLGLYLLLFVLAPLLYIFRELFNARQSAHFARLSKLVKIVMLTGILSMIFFLWFKAAPNL
jgi:4-hydroxybenzoate polyprenyltransferase